MGEFVWIDQDNLPNGGYPTYEVVGWPAFASGSDCNPSGSDPTIPHWSHRRFPLVHSPIGDDASELKVGCFTELVNAECHPLPSRVSECFTADQLPPAQILTPSLAITGLFLDRYHHDGSVVQSYCAGEWVTAESCPAQQRWQQLRAVHPLLRLVDVPGSYVRLRFTGSVPGGIPESDSWSWSWLPVTFRWSVVSTLSLEYVMYEYGDIPVLPYTGILPECQQQPVDFEMTFFLPWCDCVIDMWLASPDDDLCEYNPEKNYTPWAPADRRHGPVDLYVSEAQWIPG